MEENNVELCSICLDDLDDKELYELNCNHIFHRECIQRWLMTSTICPLCRAHVDPDPRYVDDQILSEAQRLHIATLCNVLTGMSKCMEHYLPVMDGFTEFVNAAMQTQCVQSLLREAAETSSCTLDQEREYHCAVSVINTIIDGFTQRDHEDHEE